MARTSIFSALIPAVSAVGAAMLGQETVTVMTFAGIGVVIAGVIIAQKN
jgi:drug/metabolite transporter (DMT)-like permease